MKSTFSDFISMFPKYKKFQPSNTAQYVFDNILSRDDSIIDMIGYSNVGKPALAARVNEVELYCDQYGDGLFDMHINYAKQALGTMVKVILEPFGYENNIQKDMPRGLAKYVTSAMTYEKTKQARMRIVKRIEECSPE